MLFLLQNSLSNQVVHAVHGQSSASPTVNTLLLCPPGPGAFDFTQADTTGSTFWRLVGGLLSKPTAEQVACHAPKPILLNTGFINTPYPWQPHVTELSVIRLGNIVSVPSGTIASGPAILLHDAHSMSAT